MSNYILKFQEDRKIGYLMQAGKSYVLSFMPLARAEGMLKQGKPINKTLPEKPEYPICVEFGGHEYYFEGMWENPQETSIFDDGEKKPKIRRKNVLAD